MSEIVIDSLLVLIYAVWAGVIEVILIVLMYWLFPTHRRARFKSFLTKKAYGVVEIFGKGRHATFHVANFFLDYAMARGGVYFYNSDRVYIKDGARTIHFDEADAFEAIEIETDDNKGIRKIGRNETQKLKKMGLSKNQIGTLKGLLKARKIKSIERIYFRPKKMKSKSGTDKTIRDPKMIKAVFMKQKALAESEALVNVIKKMMMLMMVAAGAAVIGLLLTYMVYDVVSGSNMIGSLLAPVAGG